MILDMADEPKKENDESKRAKVRANQSSSTSSIWERIEINACINEELIEAFMGIGCSNLQMIEPEKPETEEDKAKAPEQQQKITKVRTRSVFRHKLFGKLTCVICKSGVPQASNIVTSKDDQLHESRVDTGDVKRQQPQDDSRESSSRRTRKRKTKTVRFQDQAESENQNCGDTRNENDEVALTTFQYLSCAGDPEQWNVFHDDASHKSNVSLGSFTPDHNWQHRFMCTG